MIEDAGAKKYMRYRARLTVFTFYTFYETVKWRKNDAQNIIFIDFLPGTCQTYKYMFILRKSIFFIEIFHFNF